MSVSPIDIPDLTPAQVAQFTPIIDDILSNADLSTITPKKIILGLQERLGFDITELKKPIKALINQRFDVVSAKQHASPKITAPPLPTSTGAGAESNHVTTNGSAPKSKKRPSPTPSSSATPPPAKKVKHTPTPLSATKSAKVTKSRDETDAEMAARLQAMENGRARSTRGGGTGATVKKRSKVGTPKKGAKAKAEKKKKVSRATLDSADDSELEGSDEEDGEKKEKVKKGGFHKPMVLSATLGEFLGEITLSRPECVKRIWDYIKKHDLQDPKDRRTIRCDEALKKVFKQEKVTMFSMNKHLSGQLYAPEEA